MRIHNYIRFVHQHKLLDKLAYLDALTEIPNRRRFDEALKNEFARARRNGTPLSLGMVDVDFFKQYNDHYGHAMGDRALYAIASALESSMKRPADVVARYGGEEFTLILPETDRQAAHQVGEMARKAVLKEKIPHIDSTVFPHVSVSIGMATLEFPPHVPPSSDFEDSETDDMEYTPELLLKMADQNLYRAKQNGRNQVY